MVSGHFFLNAQSRMMQDSSYSDQYDMRQLGSFMVHFDRVAFPAQP